MIEFNYDKLPYERYHMRRWATSTKCRSIPHLNRPASDMCLNATYLVEGFSEFFEENVFNDGEPIEVLATFENKLMDLLDKLDDEFIHSKMQVAEDAKLYEQPEYELCRFENLGQIAEQWLFGYLDTKSPKANDVRLLSYLHTIIRRTAEAEQK